MIADNIIKKVPGHLKKNITESQGYIGDLRKVPRITLLELIERQNCLLNNRAFIMKLPDKGDRIKNFKSRLEEEFVKRDGVNNLCEVMTGLRLNGKELSERLEWEGKSFKSPPKANKSSDQEELDNNPLRILATHSGAGFHKKEYRTEKDDESLIKEYDLIEENKTSDLQEDPYVRNLCTAMDKIQPKERFLPFKSLENRKELNRDKVRDISAATPPISKHGDTKLVSLEESLKLQSEQVRHLREVQLKHAAERLKERGMNMGTSLPPMETTSLYRESPPSDSEEEIVDEDAKEEGGGVIFPLSN